MTDTMPSTNAPEYRCGASANNINQSDKVNSMNSLSYATVAQSEFFPDKEYGIILDSIDGIPLREYILAVGSLVEPRNIRFASKISNNRVCIYLSSKQLVNTLTSTKTVINIRDLTFNIRPLFTKAQRIIFSNVYPGIPHQAIIDKLKEFNVQEISSVTFIKASLADQGYSHVLSFRRQVYVHPDDSKKIPENFKITHNNTTYWIFSSTDNPVCFRCNKEDHLARHCTIEAQQITQDQNMDTLISKENLSNPTLSQCTHNDNQDAVTESILIGTPDRPKSFKRPLSTSISSTSGSTITINQDKTLPVLKCKDKKPDVATNSKAKKKKRSSSPNFDEKLSSIRHILTMYPDTYILDYNNLKDFLGKSAGNAKIMESALSYTSDIPALVKMLKEIYPSLQDRSTKNLITRINKKLEAYIACSMDNNSDSEMDCSQKTDCEDPVSEEQTSDEDSTHKENGNQPSKQ